MVLVYMYTAISASNLTEVSSAYLAHAVEIVVTPCCATTLKLVAWLQSPANTDPLSQTNQHQSQVKLNHEVHGKADTQLPGVAVETWEGYVGLLKQRHNITAMGHAWCGRSVAFVEEDGGRWCCLLREDAG